MSSGSLSPPPPSPLSARPGISYSFDYVDGDAVNQHLICQICQSPMIQPLTTTNCGHTFCSACILDTVSQLGICPVDRNHLTRNDLAPADKIIRNMLDELPVYCPHRNDGDGCTWQGQRQLVKGHLRECDHATEPCPWKGCDVELKREQLESHMQECEWREVACEKCGEAVAFREVESHPQECPAEPVQCQWCNTIVTRGDLSSHLDTCSEAEAPCPHSHHGCPWTGERKQIDSHLATDCKYEAIRGFIELSQWRYEQLAQENQQLRIDLSSTRDALNAIRADLVRDIAALAPPVDLLPHIDRLTADNERVTADVQNISADMASMDLRHNMAVMNESFRMREEMQSLRQMCQVMQSQILFLSERVKDTRGMPVLPPQPPPPKSEMDLQFGGAAERFAASVDELLHGESAGRPMGRRPSSARSNSADGSGSEGHGGRSMKL